MRYLVIGAAGHAQEVAWSLRERLVAEGAPYEIVFFDDRLPPGPVPSGLGSIAGGLEAVADHAAGAKLVLGIGLPRIKQAVVARLAGLPLPWETVIHPTAVIGPNVAVGEGSYVAAGAVLTVNVRVGRFATVNVHCQVAHESVLEDYATLHPGARLSGRVSIGEGCELGAGAVVTPGVEVGRWAVLGAGCVAVRSLAGAHVYVGVPARKLRRALQSCAPAERRDSA